MPRKTISEAEIRKLASKYVHTVRQDADKIPDIHNLITEAIKNVAPERAVEHEDIASVMTHLSRRSFVNDRAIQEAAKKVVDHSAMEDLKHMINRHIQRMGKTSTPEDIDNIIKNNKLNPHSSTLQHIQTAVRNHFAVGKPLESLTPADVRKLIATEMGKQGHTNDQDINAVVNKYMASADQDKPFNPEDLKHIIQAHMSASGMGPQPPQPTQVGRGKNVEQGKLPPEPIGKKIQAPWIPPKDPKNPTFFEKIRLKMRRYGMKSLTRGSRNWLTDTVNKVRRSPNRQALVKSGQTVAEAIVGKMFMYFYDAKTKDTLPYWDKFPLIFVIDLTEDGWYGLNLHYLPLPLRVKLFDKLLQFADDKSLDKITKLRLSYGLIKNFSQFPEVKPTIKRYLSSHVKSEMLVVEPADWEVALFLPVEQFQKEKKEHVWSESRKMIQKLKRKRR